MPASKKAASTKSEPAKAKTVAKTATRSTAASAAKTATRSTAASAAKTATRSAAAPAVKPTAPAPKRAAAKPQASATHRAPQTLTVDPERRRNYVEVAAYYIAERRGFVDGDETRDWLAAEEEIDRLLRENKLSA